MKKTFLVLPLALLVSGAVNAATDNTFYAGARLGNSFYDLKHSEGINLDNENLAGGVFMGYKVTPWFALETGYTHLGSTTVEGTDAKVRIQGADILAKFSYNVTENVDLYVKGGTYYYDAHSKNLGSEKSHGWTGTAGLGMDYFITKNLSAGLDYQYYHDIKLGSDKTDVHFVGATLAYHWGAPAPVVAPEVVYVDQVSVAKIEELKLTVPFAFDSTTITAGDASKLAPFEERLNTYPDATITVVGHTDSTGSEAYNQKLSQERAEAVAQALRTHLNVGADRVLSEGRGELDPIASNDTAEGRSENRRVDIIVPELNVETVTQVVAE